MIALGVNKSRIDLPQLVKLTSEGPAKMTGLYPRKGAALVGSDADFAIYDLGKTEDIRLEDQEGLEWTLYEGFPAVYPDWVLVRGKAVVREGRLAGKAGYGQFCSPE